MLNVSTILVLTLFAALGWMRGAVRFLLAVGALLVASLLAAPLGILAAPLLRGAGVPELLLGPASLLAAGLVCLVVLLIVAEVWWRGREPEGDKPLWDRAGGAALGALWASALMLLVLSGLTTIARVDRAMRLAQAETEIRADRRRQETRKIDANLSYLRNQMTPEQLEDRRQQMLIKVELQEIAPEEIRAKVQPGPLDHLAREVPSSLMASLVENVTPVDEVVADTLRDLAVVVADPVLFDRFQRQPEVAELKEEEKIQKLAGNADIAAAVRASDFRSLMDHPDIVDAARDPELQRKLKELQIDRILREVKSGEKR